MAKLLSGGDIGKLVAGLISEEHQVREHSIDLTVRQVYAVKGCGSLDFGGSEYSEADIEELSAVKKEMGDDHGWWNLSEGTYLITFNETVEGIEGVGFLSPHPRLLKAGCTHQTLFTLEWASDYVMPLRVCKGGLKLKENARISKLMVIKT